MTTLTFDTLAYAKTLKDAGFTAEQAEAQAGALAGVLKTGTDNLATKGDLDQVEKGLKRDIDLLRAEMNQRAAETKAELIRWGVRVGILQTTLLVGILARLAKVI